MDFLCPIVAMFLVVSLLGHGFWLFVRTVIRVLFSNDSQNASDRWCSRCRVKLKPHEVRCPSCEQVLPKLRRQYADDLRATRRQLQRFRDDGVLEPDEAERLLKLLLTSADPEKIPTRAPARKPHTPPTAHESVAQKSSVPTETREPESETAPSPLVTPESVEEHPEVAAATDATNEPGPTIKQLLDRGRPTKTPASTAAPKPAVTAATESEPESGRSLGELLGAFMEDRNIRWGELISSVLIVGCSIGLVINLWSTLESIPYFPALLFLLVTAAIHGAGLYTLRRWRLKTTSRGLLTIAQLLIPLNFLAAISLSNRGTVKAITDPLVLGAIAIGCSVFGAISISGSRVLSRPFKWWPLSLAALLPCLAQIVINRSVTAGPLLSF
jgi:hypothetical protein